MEQLNAKQLDELKTLLASVGLEVRKLTPRRLVTRQAIGDSQAPAIGDSDARELRDRIKRVQGMAFKTGGIKSRLLRNMRDALANGYGFQRGVVSVFVKSKNGRLPKVNCPRAIADFYRNPWLNQYMPRDLLLTYQPTEGGKRKHVSDAIYRTAVSLTLA